MMISPVAAVCMDQSVPHVQPQSLRMSHLMPCQQPSKIGLGVTHGGLDDAWRDAKYFRQARQPSIGMDFQTGEWLAPLIGVDVLSITDDKHCQSGNLHVEIFLRKTG